MLVDERTAIENGILWGSRWKCLHVERMQKVNDSCEMVLTIGLKLSGKEIAAAALRGPSGLMDLLAIPGVQLTEQLLRAKVAEARLEKIEALMAWVARGGAL